MPLITIFFAPSEEGEEKEGEEGEEGEEEGGLEADKGNNYLKIMKF